MKLRFWWLIAIAAIWAVSGAERAFAAPLVWQTPYGTMGLPFESTEALLGYDAVLKQAIGGVSLPVYSDPKGIVSLNVGAVAPWPVGNQSTIQPYISASHNILKEIPMLNEFQSLGLNIFGRYDPGVGKAGVGLSFSYKFAGPTSAPAQ